MKNNTTTQSMALSVFIIGLSVICATYDFPNVLMVSLMLLVMPLTLSLLAISVLSGVAIYMMAVLHYEHVKPVPIPKLPTPWILFTITALSPSIVFLLAGNVFFNALGALGVLSLISSRVTSIMLARVLHTKSITTV